MSFTLQSKTSSRCHPANFQRIEALTADSMCERGSIEEPLHQSVGSSVHWTVSPMSFSVSINWLNGISLLISLSTQ